MKQLENLTIEDRKQYPVKVMQFGEGNFLRAFVDWMIQKANNTSKVNMGVVIVQPIENGIVDMFHKQDCMYHVILEGVKDGRPIRETERIDCVMDALNPYQEYQKYESYFLSSDLEFLISNTTEAGIVRLQDEDITALPPRSFPVKITALLHKRFLKFNGDIQKGLDIICCELIENNALVLQEIVFELAEANQLGEEFIKWLKIACTFNSSLVDRIVSGFPKDRISEIQTELGYADNLLVIGEYFHLWAIDSSSNLKERFPLDQAGLNVVWLDDLKGFRDKKVRVLNGAHTSLASVGVLLGHATVKDAFADKVVSTFIKEMIYEEISPNIKGDLSDIKQFADEIIERFLNPYIFHYLKDISLNSISKWMTRNYPSFIDDYNRTGILPKRLSFSLAALLLLYKPHQLSHFTPNDDVTCLEFIQSAWSENSNTADTVQQILSNEAVWQTNLAAINGLTTIITHYIDMIENKGISSALAIVNNK